MMKHMDVKSDPESRMTQEDTSADPEKCDLIEHEDSHADSSTNDETKENTTSRSRYAIKATLACLLYMFCSVSMVLTNKSLASSYNHLIGDKNINFLLVVFQAIIAVISVQFSKNMGWVEYPDFDTKTARQWAPVNIAFCAMLFTGMASLETNSVPMVTVFKNLTNVFVVAGDYYFFNSKVEVLIVAAFGVMLGGAIFAAKNDLNATATGIFWMFFNCISTSGYILCMKFATKTVKLSKFGMVFYNNVLCTLFLFPVAVYKGELKVFLETSTMHTPGYFIKNSFAGFVGFFLNFASLNCVALTGPTTYTIVGSLNRIPTVLSGWIIFRTEITSQTWFFISVSLFGGFLFSFAKINESRRKKKENV